MAISRMVAASISEDAITGEKFAADTYLANTTNQNISGTYSENRMYTSDAYTLSGNATVNANLVLSSVKEDGSDIVLTASGAYTITGTGVLVAGGDIHGKTPENFGQITSAENITASSIVLTPSSTPSTTEGTMYYDSTSDKVVVYNGTAWEQVSNLIGFEAKATGGHITNYTIGSTNYVAHTFLKSGVFTPTSSFNIDYLIVAGGGAGGGNAGGGGGAGGFKSATGVSVVVEAHIITIGAGGQGDANSGANGGFSSIVSDSITDVISTGGGGAGSNNDDKPGYAGGSGGGGGMYTTAAHPAGAALPANQGYAGAAGSGTTTQSSRGGGGGGAGGVGVASTPSHGGPGKVNSFRTGSNIYYAGGGGAGAWSIASGDGGAGGGGDAADGGEAGLHGDANTGGGGGGGGTGSGVGGSGGSGIVIIRYTI